MSSTLESKLASANKSPTGPLSEEQLAAVEQHLSNPEGEAGIEIAKVMHATNIGMTKSAISALNLQPDDTVLELGFGSGAHVSELLFGNTSSNDDKAAATTTPDKKKVISSYTGLELSETMQQEAVQLNQVAVDQKHAFFHTFDGLSLPGGILQHLQDQEEEGAAHEKKKKKFTKSFNVNCLYFWEKPVELLQQLREVIDEDVGRLVFSIASKEFLESKPFVKDRFKNRFSPAEFREFASAGGFKVVSFENFEDEIERKDTGEKEPRQYHVGVLAPVVK